MATIPDILARLYGYPNEKSSVTQEVISPEGIPNTPWSQTPWYTPPTIVQPPGPSGGTGTTPQGTPEVGGGGRGESGPIGGYGERSSVVGPLSASEESTVRGIGALAGLLSGSPFGSLAGLGIIGASKLAGLLGAQREGVYGPGYSRQEVQDIQDYYGTVAADAARAANAASTFSGRMGPGGAETGTDVSPGGGFSGGMGPGGAETGTDVSPGGGFSGGMGPGGAETGSDTGSTESGGRSETGGQGESGNAGMWARGGVSRVRKPTRALYGEAGPETAIFVPQAMERMGMQGREREVISALKAMLAALERGKRSTSAPVKRQGKG